MINGMSLFRPAGYFRPAPMDETSKFLLHHEDSRVIAGGVDLLVEKNPLVQALVDISNLHLDYVKIDNSMIHVDACTSFRHVEKDATLTRQCPSLVEAARCTNYQRILEAVMDVASKR
jgi:CO/xanthine dehydrogenase FAD-binding subunit